MANETANLRVDELAAPASGLSIVFTGAWCRDASRDDVAPAVAQIETMAGDTVRCSAEALTSWDTIFIASLVRLKKACDGKGVTLDCSALPEGAQRLAALATEVPERAGARRGDKKSGPVTRLGERVLAALHEGKDMLTFAGEVSVSAARLVGCKAQMQWADVFAVMDETGPKAFPIVGLIAGLMGIILAFVGAVQLRMFGAEIYVADLVAIGIVRSLGAIMTGIVMAGRTGASYAARIGTMQVNEEIDAFRTMGISPVDFLVLPRTIGLILMMPLLCIYADVIGVLGGMFIGVTMLDLSPTLYLQQTKGALGLTHLFVGLVMSLIFGVLVAFFGCLRGLRCGRSASSVGEATTSSVVSGIISIVIATALVTFAADLLGV